MCHLLKCIVVICVRKRSTEVKLHSCSSQPFNKRDEVCVVFPLTVTLSEALDSGSNPQLNFLQHFMSDTVKINTPRRGRSCYSMLRRPHQTRSRNRNARMLYVCFCSQISQADGSSVTYQAHTPHISLLEFTGSSQNTLSDVT